MLPYSWCVDAWYVAGQPRQHELLPARFLLLRWAGFVAGVAATTQAVELLALFSPASSLGPALGSPFSPARVAASLFWMGTIRLNGYVETFGVGLIRASMLLR